MKLKLSILYFFCLVLPAMVVLGQEKPLAFNLVSGSKDVSVGKVTSITQDKLGYMWFVDQANQKLIRFDGYRMKVFKHIPSDSNSLRVNGFECMAADSLGNVWIPVRGGLDKINSSTGVVTHLNIKFSVGSAIMVDHLGLVWVGAEQGLCQFDPKTNSIIWYKHDELDSSTISDGDVRVLYEDHEGTIWSGNGLPFNPGDDGGLNKLNRKTGKFTRYLHDANNPNSIINNRVRAIFEDSRGTFWVGTQGDGLHILDRKTGTFQRLTYDPAHPEKLSRPPVNTRSFADHITFIKEDASQNIWIGTYKQGMVRYNPETKKLTHFYLDTINSKGFADSTTWCGFTSRDGTLWVAIEGTSLYRVDAFYKPFNYIATGESAISITGDKAGNLWAGTNGNGLFRYDQQLKLLHVYKHNSADPFSPTEDHIGVHFFAGEDDKAYLGTYNGIRVLDTKTNKFSRMPNELKAFKDSATSGFVDCLQDKNGIRWFTGWGRGLVSLDPKTFTVTQYSANPKDSFSLSTDFLNHIIEDDKGRLWMGGDIGVNRMGNDKKFKHYLNGIFIGSVYQDSRNTVWAGTQAGLYRYDEKLDSFFNYFDVESDLSAAALGSITEDNDHNLWLNSSSAIVRLNILTGEMFFFREKYGIGKNSMVPWSKSYKDSSGQLFFGIDGGFDHFNPRELSIASSMRIILTDVLINGLAVFPNKDSILQGGTIEETRHLELKYNQNNIAFNFSVTDYRDPESIQYFTRLEGFDGKWREAKEEKASRYFNLPRGHYTYQIKAINSDGTVDIKTITITVNPPWWQTIWAFILYTVLIIIIISAFIRWRTKALQTEKTVLEDKVAERTLELKKEKDIVESTLAELKSTQRQLIQSEKMASLGELTAGIAHEIQNPLNFVNNFSEVNKEMLAEMKEEIDKGNYDAAKSLAASIEDNEDKINHHGKRADAIVKGMLQHSRTSSGTKELTDINALADEYLRLSYHGLRAKDKTFNADFKTDFDPAAAQIDVVPQDIGRVILNLLTNAFYAVNEKKKHSSGNYAPLVKVSTKRLGNKIEIKIEDNGNGIPQKILDKVFQPFFTTKPTGQGTGLGLSLSYDIIKSHGGDIKIATKETEGTVFTVQLPV